MKWSSWHTAHANKEFMLLFNPFFSSNPCQTYIDVGDWSLSYLLDN
jgi:hypothetical protein